MTIGTAHGAALGGEAQTATMTGLATTMAPAVAARQATRTYLPHK